MSGVLRTHGLHTHPSVLAPYRSQGLGTALVRHALKAAQKDGQIKKASVHVQVGNDAAKAFYQRLGFKEETLWVGHSRQD